MLSMFTSPWFLHVFCPKRSVVKSALFSSPTDWMGSLILKCLAINGEWPSITRNIYQHMAVCQNLVPLVNIKIAGKWMFIPLKMVLIGIDPYPYINILSFLWTIKLTMNNEIGTFPYFSIYLFCMSWSTPGVSLHWFKGTFTWHIFHGKNPWVSPWSSW